MLVIKKDKDEYRLWRSETNGGLCIDHNNGEAGEFNEEKLFEVIDKFFKEEL